MRPTWGHRTGSPSHVWPCSEWGLPTSASRRPKPLRPGTTTSRAVGSDGSPVVARVSRRRTDAPMHQPRRRRRHVRSHVLRVGVRSRGRLTTGDVAHQGVDRRRHDRGAAALLGAHRVSSGVQAPARHGLPAEGSGGRPSDLGPDAAHPVRGESLGFEPDKGRTPVWVGLRDAQMENVIDFGRMREAADVEAVS